MTSVNATSFTDYLASLDPVRTAGLIIGALVAFVLVWLLLHYATRHGRARAREAARAWADVKRVEWAARAQARADRATAQATDSARAARRAHIALIAGAGAVVLVAAAAINLSAHGIQARLDEVELGNIDARISVFLVFEGLLALAGGLSFWHQVTGRVGIDRYAIGMWLVSLVMAFLAAWGGEHWIFALFPIIAAVAGHELVVAEAKRRGKYRGILGRGATAEDSDTVGSQRRETRIVTRNVRANTGVRALRWLWARLYLRALADAAARGELTGERKARIAQRVAEHYAGARALSPDALDGLDPWAEAIAHAAPRTESAPAPASAPAPVEAEQVSARVPAPAGPVEAAPPRLHLVAPAAADEGLDVLTLINNPKWCGGGDGVRAWVRDFWVDHGTMPTGRQLADEFGGNPGNCRKWVSKIKAAIDQDRSAA